MGLMGRGCLESPGGGGVRAEGEGGSGARKWGWGLRWGPVRDLLAMFREIAWCLEGY